VYGAEAAVELLIGHESWLHRDDFVERFIETGQGEMSATPMAWVDWQAVVGALEAERLPCSDSQAQLLGVAASIAEGIPVDLRAALVGLDRCNLVLIARAVLHAGGLRATAVGLDEEAG
jgi:hypothetical protein